MEDCCRMKLGQFDMTAPILMAVDVHHDDFMMAMGAVMVLSSSYVLVAKYVEV